MLRHRPAAGEPGRADLLAECTFCATCADGVLAGHCPNCAGELVRRPIRPAARLEKFPASTVRKVKPAGCVAA
jgi:hypothetical protein